VLLVRNDRELLERIQPGVARGSRPGTLLMQRHVAGTPASVSILTDGCRAMALAVNEQTVRAARRFSYHGGVTPLEHPASHRAVHSALRACHALPGLRGYVGVDLVLTRTEAFVIEVNARLTTAYLGVRSALDANVAAMALSAWAGTLPAPQAAARRVRFTAAGKVQVEASEVWGPEPAPAR
jgi:predicted ATP-grasp superfamily ATP-dependent carboligase